ncbi:CHASE domain-containing protein [Oxalobacteraceae bacterium]|nr:CHASE domain-containing protein [Oxalobacteraceae bacterium]
MEQTAHPVFPLTPRRSTLIAIAVLALIYYLAARGGLQLAFEHSNATPVWPPSGIALGALLLGGYRLAPAILVGAFCANVASFAANGLPVDSRILLISLAIAIGNTLEALSGKALFERLCGKQRSLGSLQNVYRFAVSAALMCLVSAAIGTSSLLLGGLIPPAAQWTVAATWWVGDTAGVIVFTPLLLAWRRRIPIPPPARLLEMAAGLLLLTALSIFIFQRHFSVEDGAHWLAYLFLLCIGWSSYRYGLRGTSVVCLIIGGAAVIASTHGRGPFVNGTLNDSLIALESFIILCGLVGLVLCADASERRRQKAQEQLLARLGSHWLTLFFCLGLTVLVWHVVATSTERRAQEQFDMYVANVQLRLQKRVILYETSLRSAQALFKINPRITRANWHDFIDTLAIQQNFPGAEAFGHARLLAGTDLAAYEARIQAEGFTTFAVRPAGPRPQMAVVTYIEPFTGRNMRAFGYDLFSEAVRRDAMERAAASGNPTMSSKVTLVQESGQNAQTGFLIFLPLYASGADLSTAALRRQALQGYVYGAFRSADLMRGVQGVSDTLAQMEIFDGEDISPASRLYASSERSEYDRTHYPHPFVATTVLDMEQHRWTLRFTSLPGFETAVDRQKSQIILIAGTIISLLFFGVVRALTARQDYAMALADDMTYALRHSERRFEWLVNAASEFSIIATDLGGNILVFSAGAERMLGYSALDMVGKVSPTDLHLQAELAERCTQLSKQLHRPVHGLYALTQDVQLGQAVSQDWTYLRRDGSRLPVNVVATATADAGGRITGYLLIAKDISRDLELQRSLLAAKDLAEAASQAKSDFVANMSHEIRTPMNAVLGMAHLLAATELSGDQRKYLEMIRQSGQSLLSILNDVLDFSKIEAGRMELEPGPFRLGDVLDAVAAIMTVNAGEKDLELAIGVGPGVPASLVGDALRLQQALVNLVGNAVKFTEQGAVSVLVDCASRADDGALTLRVTVRDSGIGMSAEQLERLFRPFTQADASMSRRFGGSGLGLTISSRIVQMMSGAIEVESVPGQGSSFTISVPLQAQGDGAAGPAPLAGLRVLVVDDDSASLDAICATIAFGGGLPQRAANGADAMQLLSQRSGSPEQFELVLCDWLMAGQDGLACMAALRTLPTTAALPVVIMVNAFGRGKLMGAAGAPDASAIILKPLTPNALGDVLREVRASRSESGPNAASAGAAGGASTGSRAPVQLRRIDGVRILLVEDHPINQIVATGMLEQAGARITVADNGRSAVELLREDAGRYDLVLMDVQMPVMDGYEATRLIREELQLAIPVLAMTAGVLPSEREECIACGMDDFIAKPIEVEEMLAAIARNLSVAPASGARAG